MNKGIEMSLIQFLLSHYDDQSGIDSLPSDWLMRAPPPE